jgi:tetratricopeptide (TPR) repeat protein
MNTLDPELWPQTRRAKSAATEGGLPPELAEQLADLDDRLSIGDHPAVRLIAARLRRQYPDDAGILRTTGHGCLLAEAPTEAIRDLEASLRLDDAQADVWFWLAQARHEIGEVDLSIEALDQALIHEPDNLELAALRSLTAAKRATGWQEPLRLLCRLQAEHPDNIFVTELLAEALLAHALRGWTEVEDGEGPSAASHVLQLVKHGPEDHMEPGWYPTTAVQMKTAALCLERLRQLPVADAELKEQIEALAIDLKRCGGRHFRATWAEVGVAVILIVGALLGSGEIPLPLTLFGLVCGVPMIVGSFEPYYRSNRILLSRRKKTLGDAAIEAVAERRYGGLLYNLFVMATYPFIAAYKIYVNWGEGWIAKPEILEVLGPDKSASIGPTEPVTDASSFSVPDHLESAAARGLNPAPSPTGRLAAVRDRVDDSVARSRDWVAGLPKGRLAAAGAGLALVAVLAIAAPVLLRKASVPEATALAASARVDTSADRPDIPHDEPANPPPPRTVSGTATVSHTAAVIVSGTTLPLDGVVGEGGVAARQMESFIQEQGGQVTCERLANGAYQCRTPAGYDVAAAALVNGAARAAPSASEAYKAMQAQAVAAQRGVWRQGEP